MLIQILNDYKTFSDSIISKIEYFKEKNDSNKSIEMAKVYITSYNWTTDKFEKIILVFGNIKEFRFIKRENLSSTVITDALLKSENGEIILDFFPKQYSDSILEIDYTDSDFLIRSESILLQKLDSEDL